MSRWVDRTFALGIPVSAAPSLCERLRGTAERLEAAAQGVAPVALAHRPGGRWSIKDHIGHLTDLEAVFERRLDEYERGAPVLTAADVENRRTWEANHRVRALRNLLEDFRSARGHIMERLRSIDAAGLSRTAVHPRLQQEMSVVDLCFFVAEHDDHHLHTIQGIARTLAAHPDYALELVDTIERAVPALVALDDEASRRRPAPGTWSPKEVVGHLVDSASNNHQRFVRAMFQDHLVFDGYEQVDWVAMQAYQDAPWLELVTLWASFNRHLARVMAEVPERIRGRPRARHNLHLLAWRPVPEDTPATLDYFMRDYVAHLHHHLRQIAAITPGFPADFPRRWDG